MAELKSISTIIIEKLLLDLSDEFADAPAGEVVGVMRAGRLQDDPESAHISIMLHPGDPEAPDGWRDNIFAEREHALDRSQLEAQTFEIGKPGGSLWWRRGAVTWEMFGTHTAETRVEAERKAGVIQARIQRAIDHSRRVPGSVDDFNEGAINIMTTMTSRYEGGGPPSQFIWRGKVLWQAMTQRA